MILGAGLLLLLGLGLLVAGVLTGVSALYWGCVAACLVAAVLLVLVRRQMAGERATAERVVAARRERAEDDPAGDGADQADIERVEDRVPTAPRRIDRPPAGASVRAPETREPEVRYAEARRSTARETAGEPPLEEVEVTDLLLVMDLRDEVLVVDEHPRYHLSGCTYLAGADTFPMPIDEARSDGFTPCGSCSPDRNLAQLARERKAGRR